jgi:predicted AAA+ superfamily ATPase
MISRSHYIEMVRPFYDSDLIKIITGIRRSGKSVILEQIMAEIKAKKNNVIYLNFEDSATTSQVTDAKALVQYVKGKKRSGMCWIFLDEVQELDGFEDACRTLRLHDCSVFITGSNSKLLSGEFTDKFSGRYVAFQVRPFVYKELLEYARELGKEISVGDYLVWGGFPKRIEFEGEARRRYLLDLNETIVVNDLVRRHQLKKISLFKFFVNFVLRSNARIFSAKSIYDYIKTEYKCSVNTIMKYLDFLKEAYIIDEVRQYSSKTKRELKFYAKIYDTDVSLNSLRVQDNRYDLTHNLENVVYNELLYMGYTLTVYDNKGKEIDFRASKDNKTYYIQVAYSVIENKAYTREMGAFEGADPLSQKILITNDDFDYSTSLVRHIKLKDFLLMKDLA